jgi:hypothetical protein
MVFVILEISDECVRNISRATKVLDKLPFIRARRREVNLKRIFVKYDCELKYLWILMGDRGNVPSKLRGCAAA